MNHLNKNFIQISTGIGFCLIATLVDPSSQAKANACTPSGQDDLSGGSCYVTPTTYKIKVYEMGLCTSDPLAGTYINDSDEMVTNNTIDESTCTKTFESASGFTVDLGGNASSSLVGTNFRPDPGTYPSAYIKIKNTFTMKGSYTLGGTPYYSMAYSGNNNVTTTESNNAEFDEPLMDFSSGRTCETNESDRGMGASEVFNTGVTGTMKAVLATINSGIYVGTTSANCGTSTHLFGAFTPTSPVVITDSTQGLEVTFTVTQRGMTIHQAGGDNTVIGNFSSGPFSPAFKTF